MYIIYIMKEALKRTQIYFPLGLFQQIRKASTAQERPMSEIIRDAMLLYFSQPQEKPEKSPMDGIIGLGSSHEHDLSLNHDHYLYGRKKKKR